MCCVISYGDSVTVGELVYSLDKFRPRFPLRWQAIRLKQGDEFLPLTDDNMQKAVFDSIIYPLYTRFLAALLLSLVIVSLIVQAIRILTCIYL